MIQQSKSGNFRFERRKIFVEWRRDNRDRDSFSVIFQIDNSLKGETNMIRVSNLHWKTTLKHLNKLFLSIKNKVDKTLIDKKKIKHNNENNNENDNTSKTDNKEDESNIDEMLNDFEPRWMKICEDNNGYPKGIALVMMKSNEIANQCIEFFQNIKNDKYCWILGRRLSFDCSKYKREINDSFSRFDKLNLSRKDLTSRIMIENLRHDLTRNEILKFLKNYQNGGDKNKNKNKNKNKDKSNNKTCFRVKDIYLFQNMENTVPGYCFIDFFDEKDASIAQNILYLQWLKGRSIVTEFTNTKNEENESVNESLRGKTKRLFISNIPWHTDENSIRDFFSGGGNDSHGATKNRKGKNKNKNKKKNKNSNTNGQAIEEDNESFEIEKVYIHYTNTGFPKGYGFIDFINPEIAMNALDTLNCKSFHDRQIRV